MKPFPVAPLTWRDYDIFITRWSVDNGRFFRACQLADRRDALIMDTLEHARRFGLRTRPRDYPQWPMAMTLMSANYRASGNYDWTLPE